MPEVKPVEHDAPEIPPPDVKTTPPAPDSSKALEFPPTLPGPPKPKRKLKVTHSRPASTPVQPAPAPASSAQPALVAEPELGPMLSDDQKNNLLVSINDLVSKTESNLRVAESRNPSERHRELIKQARTFVAQALEARSRDLVVSKSLAQRAEILSRELLSQLK
jgi:hypothetical protein